MILVIRISGMVEIPEKVQDTLYRLRLRRKYSCVVLPQHKEIVGMIERVKDFIAYGKISEAEFEELINKKKKVEHFIFGKGSFEDHNLKPFFRLHPPRGGIDSKTHFPKGVLGNHGEKINALLQRML
mgnify:CR=1 FL=1